MHRINGMLFNKNKELRKNQRLIENFLGEPPAKSNVGYNSDWNRLIIVYKQIGDILFDELSPDSDIKLIEKSFENLDYWIISGDIDTAYNKAVEFIKEYFNEDEEENDE